MNQFRKQNGAIPQVEILDRNMGYMRVNGVLSLELARSAVDAAFALLETVVARTREAPSAAAGELDPPASGGPSSRPSDIHNVLQAAGLAHDSTVYNGSREL